MKRINVILTISVLINLIFGMIILNQWKEHNLILNKQYNNVFSNLVGISTEMNNYLQTNNKEHLIKANQHANNFQRNSYIIDKQIGDGINSDNIDKLIDFFQMNENPSNKTIVEINEDLKTIIKALPYDLPESSSIEVLTKYQFNNEVRKKVQTITEKIRDKYLQRITGE